MNELIDAFGLLLAPTAPLLMLAMWCVPAWRPRVACWLPWAAAPALLVALGGTPGTVLRLDGVLFGVALGFDELNRVFLAFTAMLWLGAGLHARGHLACDARAESFRLLWLATMAGNFGLIVALDVASFYTSFALMTFAAYGLVIHARSAEALRAGRVYLTMAVLGEALILTGLLLAASETATPLLPTLPELAAATAESARRDLIVACLFLGFGIKAGLPLLHLWLPLAHPVAPIPASAVLSGAMIKAGVLGWLTTLPLGLAALPGWSVAMMLAGLVAMLGAAAIGVCQRTPKTVLAYSSIAQMGFITVGVGAGLHDPALWTLLASAVALYALHHGLAKGALFLGVGIARHADRHRRSIWLWGLLALPGLSLAGVLGSGVLAKLTLKHALAGDTLPAWWALLPGLLALAAIGTTLLVARTLWLMRAADPAAPASRSEWWGWALLLAAGALATLALPILGVDARSPAAMVDLVELAWPVAAGILIASFAARRLDPLSIPAGDVLAFVVRLGDLAARAGRRIVASVRIPTLLVHTGTAFAEHLRRLREKATAEPLLRREAALVFVALLVLMLLVVLATDAT